MTIQTRKRTGDAPNKENKEKVLDRTVAEVKCRMDAEENVKGGVALTFKVVRECLDILRGAVSIVYPMGLPEYDPVRMELENRDWILNLHVYPYHLFYLREEPYVCTIHLLPNRMN